MPCPLTVSMWYSCILGIFCLSNQSVYANNSILGDFYRPTWKETKLIIIDAFLRLARRGRRLVICSEHTTRGQNIYHDDMLANVDGEGESTLPWRARPFGV